MTKHFNNLLCAGFIVLCIGLNSFGSDSGLPICNFIKLSAMEPNLTGSGINIGVLSRSFSYTYLNPNNDFTADVNHSSLQLSQLALFCDAQPVPTPSQHATAVCSVLFGADVDFSDSNSDQIAYRYRGLVPDANGSVYEFKYFVREMLFPCTNLHIDVLSVSLGTQFEDWWTRSLCRIAERDDVIIVAAIGNGTRLNDSLFYPAASSNVIGVGVIDINGTGPNLMVSPVLDVAQSSHGPCHDGRAKPDIVAPANYPVALASSSNAYGNCGNWSSYATPIVSGAAALLLDAAARDVELQNGLIGNKNCVIKSILLTSAQKFAGWHKGEIDTADDYTIPLDYQYGAGILDSFAAMELLKAGKQEPGMVWKAGWDHGDVSPGENRLYFIQADANSPAKSITVTLAWNRHYIDRYPFYKIKAADANLRLELWGYHQNEAVLLDVSDSPGDNVEHIYSLPVQAFDNYLIAVSSAASDAAPEKYAISWDLK